MEITNIAPVVASHALILIDAGVMASKNKYVL